MGAASEAARRRLFPVIIAAAAGLALAGSAARAALAEVLLVPAYSEFAMHGPGKAKGAVLWSHGKSSVVDDSRSPNPQYLGVLLDAGWDVFRNNRIGELTERRSSATARLAAKTDELAESVDELKAKGYRQVVLAGQSYGAWLSLNLADKRSDIYAVIATSPAAYGTQLRNPAHFEDNALLLADLVEGLKVGRVLVAFFRDDPFDPGGRGPATEAALARRPITHLVIDRPEIPTGHGGANGAFFARRFGPCVLALLEAPAPPQLDGCASPAALEPSGEVLLPPGLELAKAGGDAAIAPFLGEWWGIYGNGRELIFAIEKVEGERVKAIYAYGPLGRENAGSNEVAGGLADGRLLFDEPGKPRLEYRLEPDGRLAAVWNRGDTTLHAHLRKLGP